LVSFVKKKELKRALFIVSSLSNLNIIYTIYTL